MPSVWENANTQVPYALTNAAYEGHGEPKPDLGNGSIMTFFADHLAGPLSNSETISYCPWQL